MIAIRLGRVLAPLAALLAGCAHSASAMRSDDEARIVALEAELASLRRELAPARTLEQPVVVSEADAPSEGPLVLDSGAELVLPSEGSVLSDEHLAESGSDAGSGSASGGRVVLRLHQDRGPELPTVAERLPVAAMPQLPPASAAGNAGAPGLPTATRGAPVDAAAVATAPSVTATPTTALTTAYVPTATGPTAPLAAAAPAAEDLRGYREALDHLTARRFEQAVSGFSGFLRDQPGSPRADDALYFRATAYYALRRYPEARVDYERVVRIAPRGDRAADALYHAALCSRRLGEAERAEATLRRVIADYPDTGAARLAQREDRT